MFLIRGLWKLAKMITVVTVVGVIALVAIGSALPTEEEKIAAMTHEQRIEYAAEKEAKKAAKIVEAIKLEEENKMAIATLVEEVKKVPARKYADNAVIYQKLVRLAPGNEHFKSKLTHYQEQQKLFEARVAADQEVIKARRETVSNLLVSAFMVCQDSVRAQANYASKADFGGSIEGFVSFEGNGLVGGTVELMNGFGAMIPQRFVCTVKNKMVSHASLGNN